VKDGAHERQVGVTAQPPESGWQLVTVAEEAQVLFAGDGAAFVCVRVGTGMVDQAPQVEVLAQTEEPPGMGAHCTVATVEIQV
jgi:hypothetical protein